MSARLPKANKQLGQHYLKDKTVVKKILEDAPKDYDIIVEVGPGPAVITKHLNECSRPIYAIEFDRRFEEHLIQLENVKHVFFEDALKFSWNNFLHERNLHHKRIWLVSNLPYNIAAQLFVDFLQVEQITHMTLMYQKEVGEKTYLKSGAKNHMSSLLALSQCYMQAYLITKVSPGAFLPPPKVDSVVIGYERKNSTPIDQSDFKSFESFIRQLFAQKRKQLGRVLRAYPSYEQLQALLQEQGIDLTRRAESLDFDEVLKAYKTYKSLA